MPSPSRIGTATVFRPLRAGSARRGRHDGQPAVLRHFCLGRPRRLPTLRMWHVLWVQRIDAKIAAMLQRQAQVDDGRTNRPRPRPPQWIAGLGIGARPCRSTPATAARPTAPCRRPCQARPLLA
ncbi:hypothetical protein AB0L67_38355 [Streptomyces flaveolus]|uniref:hypothetical protein n=1 Tax=Streptomyces flaveolus TaxID=67297 RepID=UPI00342C6DE0